MARHGPRLAGAQHPWPGTRLHLFIDLIPTLLTRLAPPVENGGPCRGRCQGYGYHQLTNHKLRAASHMPLFRLPGRGRPARPSYGAHAGREADVLLSLTCKCWNAGEGLKPSPTAREPKAWHGASTFLQATCYEPQAIPSPSTTNYVPRTRRGGHACPPLRRDKPQATCHKPLAAVSSFQPCELLGSRALQ